MTEAIYLILIAIITGAAIATGTWWAVWKIRRETEAETRQASRRLVDRLRGGFISCVSPQLRRDLQVSTLERVKWRRRKWRWRSERRIFVSLRFHESVNQTSMKEMARATTHEFLRQSENAPYLVELRFNFTDPEETAHDQAND